MIPVQIRGWTHAHGAPKDWNGEEPCEVLHTKSEAHSGSTLHLSEWKPSPIELEALKMGGSVILGILGEGHPPVFVYATKEL